MKKAFVIILFAAFLTGCATAPETIMDTSSTSSTATTSMESIQPNSTPSSEMSSVPSSAVLSDTAVSPQYLLNVNTTNDLAFLVCMDFDIAQKFWDKDEVKIEENEAAFPEKYSITLAPGVCVKVSAENNVRSVIVDYTKTVSRDAASLMGLNGYETIESIAEKFGKENVYPYNQNMQYGGEGEIVEDVSKEMCSVILSGRLFYRANFDEDGVITEAFMSFGI